MTPSDRAGLTLLRSTPRSFASLRTGGVALGACAIRAGAGAGATVPGGLRRRRPRRSGGHARNSVDVEPEIVDRQGGCGFAGPTGGGRAGGDIAHQRGDPSVRRHLPDLCAGLRLVGRRRVRGRRCGAVRVGVDADDRRTHVNRDSRLDEQRLHHPRIRRRQLDRRLGRLYLHHDLVHRQRVAHRNVPGENLGLGQTLANIGHRERLNVWHRCYPESLVGQYAVDRVQHLVEIGQVILLELAGRVRQVHAGHPEHGRSE